MAPVNIDGTDIVDATIDGTSVSQITVDGDVVFNPTQPQPVALSNLVAWYPFDPNSYAGMTNRADDATDGLSGAANTTAFDGTVNGASYVASGGVTDIRAGANSGAFDFDGNDDITISQTAPFQSDPFSVGGYVKPDTLSGVDTVVSAVGSSFTGYRFVTDRGRIRLVTFGNNSTNRLTGSSRSTGTFTHLFATYDSGTAKLFIDGSLDAQGSLAYDVATDSNPTIGSDRSSSRFTDGVIDDVRVYNTALSGTQISNIFNNTNP